MDNEEIIHQLRNGDVEAYEKIFHLYYSSLCLFARKIVGDMDKARDIVQDNFVKLYTDRETLHPVGNFSNGAMGYFSAYSGSLKTIIVR